MEQQENGQNIMQDRLSAEKIRRYLEGTEFFEEFFIFQEIDSTNRYLKKLASEGAPAGTVVLAERQSAGRGRQGRSFFSPEEKGIYMSVLLRPEIELQKSVRITSMAAVAVARAIEKVSGIPAKIKWVNDIFLNGKKVCGILTEAGIDFEKETLEYAVLGIGVNVGSMEFPLELDGIATSIGNECGKRISRNILIAEILKELEDWYSSLWSGSFLEESRNRSILLGKEILVVDTLAEGGSYPARAIDLDDMGHLIIERAEEMQVLNSGEVSIRF
ncbi:MAG: biotin--[acetyl-CoA-carboxylase] ligase [Lachnospiraceae bacterium]|nr:biotin--[acetyl-CoA-carboxylase] ligase [Lachnospiraceae bacterium]